MQSTPARATPALAIDNVSKTYEQWQRSGKARDIIKNLFHPEKRMVHALDHVTLCVEQGEFVAYAGANGAGKSTTIKLLSGILAPSGGTVRVLGLDPQRERIALMRRAGVLFGQRTELWWDHPVITSYEWKKRVWDIPQPVYDKNLALVRELLNLDDILKTFARELSLGQRMRADLGMLLLHGPEIIFLDEPTLGLDVLAKRRMIAFLKELNRAEGTTILVTSHDMDDLEEMARRIVLLREGRLAYDGNFDGLRTLQDGLGRVCVTTASESAPVLPGLRHIRSEACLHEYAFDRAETGVHELLGLLAALPDVRDVEMRKAPIEEVIANLYLNWRGAAN